MVLQGTWTYILSIPSAVRHMFMDFMNKNKVLSMKRKICFCLEGPGLTKRSRKEKRRTSKVFLQQSFGLNFRAIPNIFQHYHLQNFVISDRIKPFIQQGLFSFSFLFCFLQDLHFERSSWEPTS